MAYSPAAPSRSHESTWSAPRWAARTGRDGQRRVEGEQIAPGPLRDTDDPVGLPEAHAVARSAQEQGLAAELLGAQPVAHVVGDDRPRAGKRGDRRGRQQPEHDVRAERAAQARHDDGLGVQAADRRRAADGHRVDAHGVGDGDLGVGPDDQMQLVAVVELLPPLEQVLRDDAQAVAAHREAVHHDAHGLTASPGTTGPDGPVAPSAPSATCAVSCRSHCALLCRLGAPPAHLSPVWATTPSAAG